MGSGVCPDCNHGVSEHTDQGCRREGGCGCDHDYSKAAKRAKEAGTVRVTYASERKYDTESRCRNCGETFGDCACQDPGGDS